MSFCKSNFLNVGDAKPVINTIISVIVPPKTTEVTVPINFAVKPLSKAPSSLEDPTKIEFTAATLPRMWSGVFNCKIVWRITTEIPSTTPLKNNAITESQKIVDIPKTIMQIPKAKIENNNFIPAFLFKGTYAEINIIINAPKAGAARKTPNPSGPTFKIS